MPLELIPVTMELKRQELKPCGCKAAASKAETPTWPKTKPPGGLDRSLPTLLPVLFGPLLASLGPLLTALGRS